MALGGMSIQLTMILKIVNYDSEYKPTVLHREPAVAEGSGVNGYVVPAVTMLTNFCSASWWFTVIKKTLENNNF